MSNSVDLRPTAPPPLMQDGSWYDIEPPASWGGKKFPRVICEYRCPANPNEYSVRGVAEGGSNEEAFLLIFTPSGRVAVTLSNQQ